MIDYLKVLGILVAIMVPISIATLIILVIGKYTHPLLGVLVFFLVTPALIVVAQKITSKFM